MVSVQVGSAKFNLILKYNFPILAYGAEIWTQTAKECTSQLLAADITF
jgi:hypothetical protein